MTKVQGWILIVLLAAGVGLLGFKYYTDYATANQKEAQNETACIQACRVLGATGSMYQTCLTACAAEAQ
ncbi:MAG TPA: hypothetical protein VJG64_00195 [Candidatus Paceibacterota bacterium]